VVRVQLTKSMARLAESSPLRKNGGGGSCPMPAPHLPQARVGTVVMISWR
jgi:hypothetical protein